jgi:hypothetical protein
LLIAVVPLEEHRRQRERKGTIMLKRTVLTFALTALIAASLAMPAHAAAPKTYQATGPVLELTADTIVIQKGSEKWEIGRDAATKVTGDLKVGSKVTIEYRMTAATVTVKPAKAAGKGKTTG